MDGNSPLSTAKPTRRLGERLVDLGYLTPEQLQVALEEQRRVHTQLGQIVFELGFVTQEELARALAEESGATLIRIADQAIDPLALARIKADYARRHRVLPMRMEGGVLAVAMADPTDIHLVDELRQLAQHPLKIFAATRVDIEDAVRKHYGDQASELRQLVDEAAREPAEPRDHNAVQRIVDGLVRQAVARNATDLHLEPEERLVRVRYRIDGFLQQAENLPVEIGPAVVSRLKILSRLNIAERRRPQDGRIRYEIDGRKIDMRLSTMPTTHGENLVLRVLDHHASVPAIGELGMPEPIVAALRGLMDLPHGMFLVTGPTGSGKTTTLYAALGEVDGLARKITSIEDPVECQVPLVRQSQVDPGAEYGIAAGLRAALRQDPDVILVGEIRDRESADVALRASLTGHLVLSSIHANSSAGAFPRLLDLGLDAYLLQSSIVAVLAQRLVRRVCRACAEDYTPGYAELKSLGMMETRPLKLKRGKGCGRCGATGYSGRTGIFELLVVDDALRALIGERAAEGEIEACAIKAGMRSFLDDAASKVLAGITTTTEVLRVYRPLSRAAEWGRGQ
ncbi:MAG: ATPase, T2SS/T4P/T4SS family [Planctomycetota bacterium]